MSEIVTDNYVIGYVCNDVIDIRSVDDDKRALLTNVERVVRLGREANRRENGDDAADGFNGLRLLEWLMAIAASDNGLEVLKNCRVELDTVGPENPYPCVTAKLTDGDGDDVPDTICLVYK